ncbi:hypothetical protein BVRB_010540 [Beta vulgaris subsp. vulgaris]|uniref:Uncharacterized protein n=1 Tax=Beta vulgaris subsp. vulgaris TaxID=3555 RepID=A0A0J8B2N1_BETVV|nr:hypothetical protein BVRB_010540 [Beta vulgaris subsp. vulgaris]
MRQQSVEALVANWVCLRVLQLRYMKSLPDSFGNLCHLRFLDVAYNYQLEVLPKSITKLYNLETLKLNYCLYLKELPRDVSKLVKLRILDLEGCKQLNHMLRGLSKLVFVHKLGMILVKSSSWKQLFEELEELRDLRSLKGYLDIEINFPCNNDVEINEGDIRRGAYLSNKEHVNFINIKFNGIECEEGALRLMEELQPHFNLKRLLLVRYYGVRMPSWARENKLKTFLPNLISLELKESRIKYMTGLGNLPHLESLKLVCLKELEYIIDYSVESTASATAGLSTAEGPLLFPSLKKLHLWVMPKLKWWRRSRIGVEDNDQVLIDNSSNNMQPKLLPQLMELNISKCPNLECNLLCPVLEKLHLREFDKRLQIRSNVSLSLSHCSNMLASSFFNIREVEIDDAEWFLNSQPSVDAFQFLTGLLIEGDKEVENLGMAMSRLTTLSILKIGQCPKLRSVSGALHYLTSLKEFEIRDCPNVSLAEGALSLPSFSHSLNRLSLRDLPKLVDLPNWMQFLEALETILIYNCQGLESLPKWMHKLTSLKELIIWNGSARLHEKCQHPTGEDWPHIQHIPSIKFY